MALTRLTAEYPLSWPEGWPRTDASKRGYLAGGDHPNSQHWDLVTHRVSEEFRLLGASNVVLTSNQPIRRDGLPYAAKRRIDDPGVSVYFTVDGESLVIAQDRFLDMTDNMRSISLAIEGMRRMQRHGGQHIMQRAFRGFTALPPPKPWHEVLGVAPDAPKSSIEGAYRKLAMTCHPDHGGSVEAMAAITAARDAGFEAWRDRMGLPR